MQARRDTWMLYQGIKSVWQNAVLQAWQAALVPKPAPRPASLVLQGAFELVGTEVAENKIIASRLALSLMEHAADEVNDLRKRLKVLNGDHDLSAQDLAHPETLLLPVVEQWTACGLSREAWQSVSELVQRHMTEQLRGAYASCNVMLKAQGVLPVIEFSARPGVSEGAAGARPDAE
jgi:hypothetical protein